MQLLDWPFLDALQTGALAALFVSFGSDALTRRDKMMGWLSITSFLVGLRHATLAIGTLPTMNPDLVDRVQSLLVAFGFIALCLALTSLFPRHVPPAFPAWMALGMVPNFIRNLVLAHPGFWDSVLHNAANLTYLLGCGLMIVWTLKARQDKDPMGRRLFLGFLGLTLPVVVEIVALSLFDLKIRLSGFSLMILAMAIGTSWQWLAVNSMESRIQTVESEVEVWRSLVPGHAFRTDRPSASMTTLFGPSWADRIKAAPEAHLLGSDGATYRVSSRPLPQGERLGWYLRQEDTQPGHHGFLSGWTVGLGLDDPEEHTRIHDLLKGWGADVHVWGTVPPREGPYPSVLIWAREPSILAVWREDDLLRRRTRWIQIGGPNTKGPHARLEPGAAQEVIQLTLEQLLSRR
ncbi:7TM diverse intracellular signaling domain-containing protein [Geothrix sp. PMB-07]|uniref:7TM diverse intracellular signaling domain-containing protein n=1 Tax=Geothrix sp. PMB-07 TaxID=3068640 RepID=UPI0027408554|nr:7TM diverse intracellular signaling domain-containing protein [Geothrix sp. PMB-07]WLT31061.1 7TM diverse intracellular signaling domain-containing protein [Geothrix sp. PMB-07]